MLARTLRRFDKRNTIETKQNRTERHRTSTSHPVYDTVLYLVDVLSRWSRSWYSVQDEPVGQQMLRSCDDDARDNFRPRI